MTTSIYGPDVRVEVAWDTGVNSPLADATWTDVSEWVEFDRPITINRGRNDERSTTSPSTCSLTLDNSDGRFTPGRSSSPYYPDVKLGRAIRVVTEIDGTESVRFTGYVDEWPVDWSDGVDGVAYAQIVASSRSARLGEGAELRSVIENEIMADDPIRYYPMGESAEFGHLIDLTGNDAIGMYSYFGGDGISLATATGPRTDGLSAPQITPFLAGEDADSLAAYFTHTMTACTIECFVLLPRRNVNDVVNVIGLWQSFRGEDYRVLQISGASVDTAGGTVSSIMANYSERVGGVSNQLGTVTTYADPATALDEMSGMFAGRTHHVALTFEPGVSPTLKTYFDGELFNTLTGATGPLMTTMPQWDYLILGPYQVDSGERAMTVSHAAVFDTILPDDRIKAHADAGLNGFEGEYAEDRFVRYANYAGFETSTIDADEGTVPLAHIDTTGKTVESLLRTIEATEYGVMFDGRDGSLVFLDRDHRYQVASAFTLDTAAQHLEAGGLRPVLDRSNLTNEVTAKSADDGSLEQRYLDAQSREDYGPRREDVEIASTDIDELFQAAAVRVNRYKDPQVRIAALAPVDAVTLDATLRDAVVEADISTKFTVANMPSQAAESTTDFFVEGVTETLGLESWTFQFNVSPAEVYDAWILGDAAWGQLGSTTVLAY